MPVSPAPRAAILVAGAALVLAALPLLACSGIEITELDASPGSTDGPSASGWSETCAAAADRVFHCTTGDDKEIAVCVGPAADPWVRYRIGPKGGAADLLFSEDRDGSLASFTLEDRVFAQGVGTVLKFESGGVTYELTERVGGGGPDGAANNFTGVYALRGDETIGAVQCGADATADWERLSRTLAASSP